MTDMRNDSPRTREERARDEMNFEAYEELIHELALKAEAETEAYFDNRR